MTVLRRATAADAAAVAEVYLASRAGAGDAIPPGVHPADDVHRYVRDVVVAQQEVWLATRDERNGADSNPPDSNGADGNPTDSNGADSNGADSNGADSNGADSNGAAGGVLGVLALDGDDVGMLYVVPAAQGIGIGTRLLQQAFARRPDGLALWAFTSNTAARRFYEHHGFRAVRATHGDNEEGAPDVRYVWGGHPEGRT